MLTRGTDASLSALHTEGYRAIRHGAAIVVRDDRAVLRVAGADRRSWLQGLLTNDLLTLTEGEARYAAWLTPQGRMITDARVIATDGAVLLDVPRTLAASLHTKLDSLIFAEDATVTDESLTLAVLDVLGPAAAEAVERVRVDWPDATVARDLTPALEARVLIENTSTASALVAALETTGGQRASLAEWNVARVEAGVPLFLIDMDETTIPLEAGLESRAISFTKGCYVGQEVIVRVLQRGGGRVARRLVGLQIDTGQPPARGETVRAGEREIGRVTSAIVSPALTSVLALAYLHRDFTASGTQVVVDAGGGSHQARVVQLPLDGLSTGQA